jgi:hypothetical protein
MLPTGLVEAVIVVGLHQAGDQLGVVLKDAPDGAKLVKTSTPYLSSKRIKSAEKKAEGLRSKY